MELTSYFQRKTRDDGSTFVTLTDDAPEWLRDAVYAAHDGEMPNDWRYSMCESIVDALADYGYPTDDDAGEWGEIADSHVEVYNHQLAQWLADNVEREQYVSAWHDDYGSQYDEIWSSLRGAQYVALSQMVAILADAITENMGDES